MCQGFVVHFCIQNSQYVKLIFFMIIQDIFYTASYEVWEENVWFITWFGWLVGQMIAWSVQVCYASGRVFT